MDTLKRFNEDTSKAIDYFTGTDLPETQKSQVNFPKNMVL